MPNDVEDLLVRLTEMIHNALTLPLGKDRCVIDKDKALALLDEITAAMPGYVREAKRIASDEAQIISRAKREAETMRKSAEELSRRLVSEEEVLLVAKQKAKDVISQAEMKSREVLDVTNKYVDNTLKRTEESVEAAFNELRKARVEFRKTAKKELTRGEAAGA
jgi:cell division septum initiation protein DivIVA